MSANSTVLTLSMDLSDFKPPRLPIARTAARMGHRDNLDGGLGDQVNYPLREASEEKFSRATQMHRPPLGTVLDLTDGVIEFRGESIRGRGIAFGIPLVGSLYLSDRVRMEPTLGAATGSSEDLALRHGPGNRLYFSPIQIIDASRNFLTPIQHPHRLSHPSFQADDRQARLAPRWEGARPLSKLSRDWASCLQIKRRIGIRQSIPITAKEATLDHSEDRQASRSDDSAECAGAGGSGD